MGKSPTAFMSYARSDDQHEGGRITEFRKRLSGEFCMQTGKRLDIFQDWNNITWGQQWQGKIIEEIDAAAILIPIITPSFFMSDRCREEVVRFRAREMATGRNDLILPLYYVNCPILEDPVQRNLDPLAELISGRNYADWRKLRFKPIRSSRAAKRMEEMALQIAQTLGRSIPQQGPAALSSGAHGPAEFAVAQEGAVYQVSAAAPPATPESEIRKIIDGAVQRRDHAPVSNGSFNLPHQVVWLTEGRRGVFEEYDLPENVSGTWAGYTECIAQIIRRQNRN